MRKWTLRAAVSIGCFAIGVGVVSLPVVSRYFPQQRTIPYCEVARNGEQYHNRYVRVRATLIFGSDGMYIYEKCDPVEAPASRVELEGLNERGGRGFVEEVLVTGDRPPLKKVDVIVEGLFDGEYSRGCWGPKYHLAARKIELMSPVVDYVIDAGGESREPTQH